jgi:hypothetical protein
MIRGTDGHDRVESIQPVRFVPLIGSEGWPDEQAWLAGLHEGAGSRSRLGSHR